MLNLRFALQGMDENEFVERLQNDVEMFDVETEIFISACQVVSACTGCIAHSANDTANAVGPFAAILTIYQHGIGSSITCPWYILLFGGMAMSLGLALLGYRVIKTVGVKLVKITPARGFSMELGAAWVRGLLDRSCTFRSLAIRLFLDMLCSICD